MCSIVYISYFAIGHFLHISVLISDMWFFLRTSILINETAVYKRIRTKTFLGKKEFIGENITCVLMNVKQPSPEKSY